MEETFTRDEVVAMLVSVFMFSGANNNQGTKDIKGVTYGEKAHHVINIHNTLKGSDKSMISAVGMLRRNGVSPATSEFVPELID